MSIFHAHAHSTIIIAFLFVCFVSLSQVSGNVPWHKDVVTYPNKALQYFLACFWPVLTLSVPGNSWRGFGSQHAPGAVPSRQPACSQPALESNSL